MPTTTQRPMAHLGDLFFWFNVYIDDTRQYLKRRNDAVSCGNIDGNAKNAPELSSHLPSHDNSLHLEKKYLQYNSANRAQYIEQTKAFFQLIEDWNASCHLVAANAAHISALIHHGQDALRAMPYLECLNMDMLVDIGSGGGFPGLMLSIWGAPIVLIERHRKKYHFLQHVKRHLNISDNQLKIYQNWLEFYQHIKSSTQLLVTSRAMGDIPTIIAATPWHPQHMPPSYLLWRGACNNEDVRQKMFQDFAFHILHTYNNGQRHLLYLRHASSQPRTVVTP